MSPQDPEWETGLQDLSRALFGNAAPEVSDPPPDPAEGNHVPQEGNNPRATATDMHQYVRDLFHHND